jgi:hypothetical protein
VLFVVGHLTTAIPNVKFLLILPAILTPLYFLSVWTGWVGNPLFDFLLWLRRDTRELLAQRDRVTAVCVGCTVCGAPVAAALIWAAGNPSAAVMAPFSYLSVAIPVAGCLQIQTEPTRSRGILFVGSCIAMLVIGTAIATYHGLVGEAIHPKTGRAKEVTGQILFVCAFLIGIVSAHFLRSYYSRNELE